MQTGVLNFEQLHASQARQNESLPRKLTSNSLYFFFKLLARDLTNILNVTNFLRYIYINMIQLSKGKHMKLILKFES